MKEMKEHKTKWHPDHHILPALFSLNDALKYSLKDGARARRLAWAAIQHAEICGMSQVIRSAQALLSAIRW